MTVTGDAQGPVRRARRARWATSTTRSTPRSASARCGTRPPRSGCRRCSRARLVLACAMTWLGGGELLPWAVALLAIVGCGVVVHGRVREPAGRVRLRERAGRAAADVPCSSALYVATIVRRLACAGECRSTARPRRASPSGMVAGRWPVAPRSSSAGAGPPAPSRTTSPGGQAREDAEQPLAQRLAALRERALLRDVLRLALGGLDADRDRRRARSGRTARRACRASACRGRGRSSRAAARRGRRGRACRPTCRGPWSRGGSRAARGRPGPRGAGCSALRGRAASVKNRNASWWLQRMRWPSTTASVPAAPSRSG